MQEVFLHIYVCRNTSCRYIYVHGTGNVPAHHVHKFFLPIVMFRNTIYMCRNTAYTYTCVGTLPAHIDVQEYFLPIHMCRNTSCTYIHVHGAGTFPAHHAQEFFLPINMFRNTSCTYRGSDQRSDTMYIQTLPFWLRREEVPICG